ETPRPPAVIRNTFQRQSGSDAFLRVLPAWIVSGVVHSLLFVVFFLTTMSMSVATPSVDVPADAEGQVEDATKTQDLTPTDVGVSPGAQPHYSKTPITGVSGTGPVDATAELGPKHAPPDGVLSTIPPPLRAGGRGTGGGVDDANNPGMASNLGT